VIFGGFHWPFTVPYWPLLERMVYYTEMNERVNMSKQESFKVQDSDLGRLLTIGGKVDD
jgi:hypothetical protein